MKSKLSATLGTILCVAASISGDVTAADLAFSPADVTVAPGASVQVNVNLTAGTGEQALGATYFVNVQSGPDPSKVQLTSLVPGTSFDQLQTSTSASFAKDLGGFNSNLNPTTGPGPHPVSTISLRASPDAPVGEYVLAFLSSGAKKAVFVDPTLNTGDFATLGTLRLTVSGPVDSDGDGMSDAYEALYPGLLDPYVFNDKDLDSDSDGLSDGDEEKYGTNPTVSDRNSVRVQIVQRLTGPERLQLSYGPVRPGLRYSLRYKTSANPANPWSVVADHVGTAEQPNVVVNHTITLTPGQPVYYQVFLLPLNP
jgi:hypothetical protein